MRWMRMEDAVHVWPSPVDPKMEPRRWIRHSSPLDGTQILVDEQQVARRHFIEPVAEAGRPERAGSLRSSRNLSRESRLVVFASQHPAGQRQLLSDIIVDRDEVLRH